MSVFSFLNKASRNVLWRTGLGRLVAERYWQNRDSGEGFRFLYREKEDVFADIPARFSDVAFSEFIAADSKRWSMQESLVVEITDVTLEPERLLGTRAGRHLVEQTVTYKHDRQYPYILPNLLRPANLTEFDEAIWYDGSATRNYYHHFVDALSGLSQFKHSGLAPKTPLLITRQMYETIFFQYLFQRSAELQKLNWYVVGDKEWIRVKKLYKFQTAPFSSASWRAMRERYALPNLTPWRKVFLNRDRKRFGRYLDNENETVAMLKQHGFEEVFAENLTIEQQAILFQETKYLVALTGAGLIQQFFMNYEHAHVIEIMPRNRLMPEYYWQAYTLGIKYFDVVVGGPMRDGKEYRVDVIQLTAAVELMFKPQPLGRTYGLVHLSDNTPTAVK